MVYLLCQAVHEHKSSKPSMEWTRFGVSGVTIESPLSHYATVYFQAFPMIKFTALLCYELYKCLNFVRVLIYYSSILAPKIADMTTFILIGC